MVPKHESQKVEMQNLSVLIELAASNWFQLRQGIGSSHIGSNKLQRTLNLIRAIEGRATDADDIRPMLEFVETVLGRFGGPAFEHNTDVQSLAFLLEVDGYQLSDGELISTTPGPAAIGPEVSALETQLTAAGLNVTSTHYRQACDNFADRNCEAANVQIRSFLESLFVAMRSRLASREFTDAGASLQHLRQGGS